MGQAPRRALETGSGAGVGSCARCVGTRELPPDVRGLKREGQAQLFSRAKGIANPVTRESAHDKGRRYLVEGRLTVRQVSHAGVVAFVRGNGLVYRAEWSPDLGWICNCLARTDQCAHLVALRLVTVANPEVSA